MAKRQVEIDITPSLEDIPDLLVDAAGLIQDMMKNQGSFVSDDVRLQEQLQHNEDLRKANEDLKAHVQRLRAELDEWEIKTAPSEDKSFLQNMNKALKEDVENLKAKLQEAQTVKGGQSQSLVWWAQGSVLHQKPECFQVAKGKNVIAIPLWMPSDKYDQYVEQHSSLLCGYCYKWSRNRPDVMTATPATVEEWKTSGNGTRRKKGRPRGSPHPKGGSDKELSTALRAGKTNDEIRAELHIGTARITAMRKELNIPFGRYGNLGER